MITELAIILDRSGSMASVASDIKQGFDLFITNQRAAALGDFKVSLTQFDSQAVETLYSGMAIASVPALVLEPRGTTPLLDAIGKTVNALKDRLAREGTPEEGRRVLVMILTDGQENASREFTKAQIKALIETQQKAGWDFIYLGANVDAFAEAGSLGIGEQFTSGYNSTPEGVKNSFLAVSSKVSTYRTDGDAAWTPQERAILTTPDKINP